MYKDGISTPRVEIYKELDQDPWSHISPTSEQKHTVAMDTMVSTEFEKKSLLFNVVRVTVTWTARP
jgi:hypothetical protein